MEGEEARDREDEQIAASSQHHDHDDHSNTTEITIITVIITIIIMIGRKEGMEGDTLLKWKPNIQKKQHRTVMDLCRIIAIHRAQTSLHSIQTSAMFQVTFPMGRQCEPIQYIFKCIPSLAMFHQSSNSIQMVAVRPERQ